jgi:hypothetical protein
MKKYYFIVVTMLILSFIFFLSCSEESGETLVTMKVYVAPIPVLSEGAMNLAYCVDFTDFTELGLTLVEATIINDDNGSIIETYSDSVLDLHMVMPSDPLPTEQEKQNGTKKQDHPVFYVWLKLNLSEVPLKLSHEFIFTGYNNQEIIESGPVVVVNNVQPDIISPPMKGEGWFTIETTELLTHHFKNEVTYDGEIYCPERFAVDYLQIDSDNNFFIGDEKVCENWVCYGKELLAVADGIVTATHDGVPDNRPVGEIFDLEFPDMAGNHVIIDIGNNHYVAFCHMIPGSIKVKVDDEVKAGDILGLVGNSGNSGAPHLHFQIIDGNSFCAGEGLPYVINSFSVSGYATMNSVTDEFDVSMYATPEQKQNELPENLRVLDFK